MKETVSSEKYVLQPRAHNSILPMSVDTLPLTLNISETVRHFFLILHIRYQRVELYLYIKLQARGSAAYLRQFFEVRISYKLSDIRRY